MAKADVYPMHSSPRCTAMSKRSGVRCCNPAVKGWTVCRMHGARSGAKPGPDHPNFRHGQRTKEAMALRAQVMALVRESREVEQMLRI
ncbi:hypothetical protein [Paracoccus denitrificans]|uniref:hypothetical protein n=1 Tax=Paracoccus denitrificans TaxID=266 RepID=UPI0033650A64